MQISNWEANTLSGSQIKYAAKDALISIEIYSQLLKFTNLVKPPLLSEIKGGTVVDITPYLESTGMLNEVCIVVRSIVVSDRQDWSVPLYLFEKYTCNADLQKGKYLIEVSEILY